MKRHALTIAAALALAAPAAFGQTVAAVEGDPPNTNYGDYGYDMGAAQKFWPDREHTQRTPGAMEDGQVADFASDPDDTDLGPEGLDYFDIDNSDTMMRTRASGPDRVNARTTANANANAANRNDARRGMNRATVLGRITDIRDVKLQDRDTSHRLARIQSDSGRTYVVDLGAKDQLEGLDLQNNDRLLARGHRATISGHQVIVATAAAELQSPLIQIDRSPQR